MTDYEGECIAEFIDGSYDVEMCACPACRQEEGDRIEADVEQGTISEAEALERHARAGTL